MFLAVRSDDLLLVSGKVLYDYIRAVGYFELSDTDTNKMKCPSKLLTLESQISARFIQ